MYPSQPLFDLTAADLMSRDVVTVRRDMPVPTAAGVLAQAGVGGVPVVDAEGRCVGVFSRADLIRRARPDTRAACTPGPAPDCVCTDWEIIDYDDWDSFPADTVGQHMTADPVMVAPETPVGKLAGMMVDAQIHRLIVAGPDHRPVGIVAGTDVLAALARAARWR